MKTLAGCGIAETHLSAADFTTIAEWEKQEIPIDFLTNRLQDHVRISRLGFDRGITEQLEALIIDEYAASLSKAQQFLEEFSG